MTYQEPGPTEEADMNNDELLERIHALETAQATQAATQAGAEATQGAVQAGNMATTTAMTTGTMTTMAAGSIGLIVGIFPRPRYRPSLKRLSGRAEPDVAAAPNVKRQAQWW